MNQDEKKIIFVAGGIYPYASPTGGICLDIAREFNKKEKVKLVSSLTEYPVTTDTEFEGMELTVFYNSLYKMRFFFSQKESFLYKLGLNCVRVIDRLNTLLFVPKNGWWYWKKVYSELKKELDAGRAKAIITFSEPFEAHWAARKLKEEGYQFNWIAFFADSFAIPSNKRNLFISLDQMRAMEDEVLKTCDSFFVTPEIDERCKDQYAAYAEKKNVFPYMIKNLVQPAVRSDSSINLVYAGRFYSDIRNPEKMLQTIVAAKVPGLHFDLYTKGDCESIVRKYQDENPDMIHLRDMVQRDQLNDIYANADILVNMENKSHEFKPSKQYEYISTGKPILSFYYFEPDAILAKYPYALQIQLTSNLASNQNDVKNFIISCKGKFVDYEEIKHIYPSNSLEHVVNEVRNLLS